MTYHMAPVVKNLPANAGDVRDAGSIPGLERSREEGMATYSSILAWRIPWTEEPGRLQSIALQRVRHAWSDLAHTYITESLFCAAETVQDAITQHCKPTILQLKQNLFKKESCCPSMAMEALLRVSMGACELWGSITMLDMCKGIPSKHQNHYMHLFPNRLIRLPQAQEVIIFPLKLKLLMWSPWSFY